MNSNFFISNDFKLCDLCKSSKFTTLIDFKGKVMTSDHQIILSRLNKIECKKCGLVRNGFEPDSKKIKNDYQKNYGYNSGTSGDMKYFTPKGSQDRSSHTLERILKLLSKKDLNSIKTIVEIGCGEGNLLSNFQKKFPNKKFIGYEINEAAIKIGKNKGLDIRPLKNSSTIKADLVISYTVIEHTTSPKHFLNLLSKMLNPGGILILGTPHQDNIFYDIFFVDHLFHFSTKHLQELGRVSDLRLIKKNLGTWPINSIVLCSFKKSKRKLTSKIIFHKTKVPKSIKYYTKIFDNINIFLAKNHKLTIFGLGEIFILFFAYTNLKNQKISLSIEDFPSGKFPFPISPSQNIDSEIIEKIMFCVNPNYYSTILKRLKIPKTKIFLPFKN